MGNRKIKDITIYYAFPVFLIGVVIAFFMQRFIRNPSVPEYKARN